MGVLQYFWILFNGSKNMLFLTFSLLKRLKLIFCFNSQKEMFTLKQYIVRASTSP